MNRAMKAIFVQQAFSRLVPIVCAAVLIGCSRSSEEPRQNSSVHEEEHETIVRLTRHRTAHTGIRTEVVKRRSLPIPLDLTGKITFNERQAAHVTSRLDGRIERVAVFTNDRVKTGQVLLEVFSQEYLTVQFEFLQACERRDRAPRGTDDERSLVSVVESARRKLLILGSTAEEIQKLESSRTVRNTLEVRSPIDGVIVASTVRLGETVTRGTDLFEVANIDLLWVLADLYEKDLALVKPGIPATVLIESSERAWPATVTSVAPVVDDGSRTVKARLDVINAGGLLKPGMFCRVKVQTQWGSATIKVPESALLGETEKHFVFVALNDTTFERRDVRTGLETREYAEVLDGLVEGERIVVAGGFFLKSELAKETFGEEH